MYRSLLNLIVDTSDFYFMDHFRVETPYIIDEGFFTLISVTP